MTSFDDSSRMLLRNMLLGRWAATKLGLRGQEAKSYAEAFVRDSLPAEGADVFSRIRDDFNRGGVTATDEEILNVMTDLMLQAGDAMPSKQGGSTDRAAMMLKRTLSGS
jgi:hypothetical protein